MATTRRSSFGASSINSARRMSSSSSHLPPLPPSTDSLTSATSIPPPTLAHPPSAPLPQPTFAPPAPLPPPKDPASKPMPITPQRKPVLRQKSPLSNEAYFASPASSMPGTFPTTPPASSPVNGMAPAQFSTTAYASASSPSTISKSPKRPISVRSLLSFKALRRSSDHTSPDSQKFRPMSPGADSTLSSSQPSLNKKRSGSFWRRKSSLGMTYGRDGDDDNMSSSPVTGVETVMEEAQVRSPTPGPGSDFPLVQKRKSGTFWRRKSSLSLASGFNGNTESEVRQNGGIVGTTNGIHNAINGGPNGTEREQHGMNGDHRDIIMEEADTDKPLPALNLSPIRSKSPPPQLPAFVGGGEGFGDLFKDIN